MPHPIQSLCIFCSASSAVDERYLDLAASVGAFCASRNIRVIYGGARDGLMGAVADSALGAGGEVVGVIPEILARNPQGQERAHAGLSALHVVADMHTRQQKMADLADGFLVLPGGLGTLAEFFEIVTWKSIGVHDKPIMVLNAFGYWDGLVGVIAQCAREGFLHQDAAALFQAFEDVEQLSAFLSKG